MIVSEGNVTHIDLSFRTKLASQAENIDLSPRQWYLLANEINLGEHFRANGDYDLGNRRDDSIEALRMRAAKRLVRNGQTFVRTANGVEVALQSEWRVESPPIQRLPDDASPSLRMA